MTSFAEWGDRIREFNERRAQERADASSAPQDAGTHSPAHAAKAVRPAARSSRRLARRSKGR